MDTTAQEREYHKVKFAEGMAKLAKEHPETDFASKGDWWVQSIDFTFDAEGHLPAETVEKLNACLQRIIDEKYAPSVVDSVLDESKTLLIDHKDLLARFDSLFGNHEFWDKMHKHELEKEKRKSSDENSNI